MEELNNVLDESELNLLSKNLSIKKLGEGIYDSPIDFFDDNLVKEKIFIDDEEKMYPIIESSKVEIVRKNDKNLPLFELGGARKKLYFEPGKTKSAIVTCGGLCPGLNAVIRGIVMMNYYLYKNQITYGIKYGFEGLVKEKGHEVMLLTPDMVRDIHLEGGTILGSSRGPQDFGKMVDRLEELGISILYTVGGDGTQKGALSIQQEIEKRGLKISVIGIPKTIDNDIYYVQKSFGFETAFSKACEVIYSAHVEAEASYNGVGIVKVMGRDSGFIAAYATIASNLVNFCLVPELDFDLEGENGLLKHLERRLLRRKHAVIVVAEGAGQKYVSDPDNPKYDASGNLKLGDIGVYLKEKIKDYFHEKKIPVSIKYIDPSYTIRSTPTTPNDSIFCIQLAQMAVHAGMSGRTGMIVGYYNDHFIHIPMELATLKRKKLDLASQLWLSVLESTGQPANMKN
ncbi:MAG: ATP-dependent 6-phosphofructokinase [Brevinematales bacterium]|nr:ATP-dependent 6-phosphofructokinase [Brevinematales bacterium]